MEGNRRGVVRKNPNGEKLKRLSITCQDEGKEAGRDGAGAVGKKRRRRDKGQRERKRNEME